jgi:hypothetical protein
VKQETSAFTVNSVLTSCFWLNQCLLVASCKQRFHRKGRPRGGLGSGRPWGAPERFRAFLGRQCDGNAKGAASRKGATLLGTSGGGLLFGRKPLTLDW